MPTDQYLLEKRYFPNLFDNELYEYVGYLADRKNVAKDISDFSAKGILLTYCVIKQKNYKKITAQDNLFFVEFTKYYYMKEPTND
jgi:hypothetical protein